MIKLTLVISTACNIFCRYCFSVKKNRDYYNDMDIKVAERIKNNINMPVERVSLSGGEPLLYEKLFDIYQIFAKDFKTSITTNGLLIDKRLDSIAKNNTKYVTVSLNSLDQEVDCKMRGINCDISHVINNILKISEIIPVLKINTLVTRYNIEKLKDLGEFVISLGKPELLIWKLLQITDNANILCDISDLLISVQEFERIFKHLKDIYDHRVIIEADNNWELNKKCFLVNTQGKVFNMSISKETLGDLSVKKLSEILLPFLFNFCQ